MKTLLIILSIILLNVSTIFAADIKLKWNPNTEADLAGYKVHYGSAHRVYTQTLDVANITAYTLTVSNAGTYYICITAYDSSGNESDYSYEIVMDVKISIVTGLVSG